MKHVDLNVGDVIVSIAKLPLDLPIDNPDEFERIAYKGLIAVVLYNRTFNEERWAGNNQMIILVDDDVLAYNFDQPELLRGAWRVISER